MSQNEGVKYDQDKPDWSLLPLEPIEDVVDVLTFGAKKYSPDNWKKVPDLHNRYFAAAMRHLVAWKNGEILDPESGKPHLAHAQCCLVFLAWFDKQHPDHEYIKMLSREETAEMDRDLNEAVRQGELQQYEE